MSAAGALHAIWASGSPWPASSAEHLADAVVGNSTRMPDGRATWVVAGGAFCAGAVVAGGFGEGRAVVACRRLMGLGLLARAIAGGEAALRVVRLPPPGERFRELDQRYCRPLSALLGLAILMSAKK